MADKAKNVPAEEDFETPEAKPPVPKEEPMGDLEFSLTLKERKVKVTDAKGVVHNYTLRELKGPGRSGYSNLVASRVKALPGGEATVIKDTEGIQEYLISKSLWDEAGLRVPIEVIKGWPGTVIAALFKAAQRLSGLGQEAEDDAKND